MENKHKRGHLTEHAQLSENTKVILSTEAYFRMIYHGYQYANPSTEKSQWKEVMGWLSGSIEENKDGKELIHVTQAWPISHGDAVSVTIDDYGTVLASILEELDKTNEKESILGWYHTHPGYGLFMSQVDFDTQKSYQKLYSKAIALVLDQTLLSSIHLGFKIFRLQQDLVTFERISYKLKDDYNRQLLPKLLNVFQEKIESGVTIKEFDTKKGK